MTRVLMSSGMRGLTPWATRIQHHTVLKSNALWAMWPACVESSLLRTRIRPFAFRLTLCRRYSPRALSKLRRIIGSRRCYMVPHRVGPEDVRLAQVGVRPGRPEECLL
jgi:hypothetical protein